MRLTLEKAKYLKEYYRLHQGANEKGVPLINYHIVRLSRFINKQQQIVDTICTPTKE